MAFTAAGAQSVDGKCTYVLLRLAGDIGQIQANQSVDAVRDIIKKDTPPPGLKVFVSGAAPLASDTLTIANASLNNVTIVTILLIVVMLGGTATHVAFDHGRHITSEVVPIVLSVIGWGSLSRQVRAKVLALRDLDYVMAARLTNCSTSRIIIRHLFPNTLSHVIVVATLAIPGMILGETALSFLGLGIRAPMTSWGLLLSDAQQLNVLLGKPWLLWAIVPVMVTAICFNLVGDGLRDAADPFAVE